MNLYEAKTHLSELVERAARGEEIIISKAGVPKARLVAMEKTPRRLAGAWAGRVQITEDFDAPLPEAIVEGFEGKDDE